MFTGSMVALVTPFKKGKIDEAKIPELVEYQISKGTDVICPCGCTGEAATLNHDEQVYIIEITVEAVNRRAKVIAGTGSNSTEEAIILTRRAKQAGADGALMITPYYNKPTQRGLMLHYEKVAAEVDIPIMLYNVPGRTGVNMTPETVAELSEIENIVAIKEASGNVDQVSAILSMCDITVLSGDDSLTLPMLAVGAKGVVSVAANVAPAEVAALIDSFNSCNMEEARQIHYQLLPLFKVLFCETNPIPVKRALNMMGLIENELRSPLFPLSPENEPKLRKVLEELNLLELV
ncbi:MAG: 4-hydroxy-tetrahydrodipicolinate synthase [Candidatus Abyssobacteria bacterium SURF_5]|uniref:4-hydroxy-tetrahydrodipicolinate synthase n=1 Tax=Abyssobacteria bacterium (strain SURF_5) TaxID=2093360 RepID=A0A3A4NB20_ABYX5|nr:MAG: 4-hydroxy-tetrahydrodipicolinate synthase [Candidatus Abyssubacteria bacterium SURF_5]